MDMGVVTTVVSDIALILAAFYTGATISNDLIVGASTGGIMLVLAVLDMKFPEKSAQVDQVLDILRKVMANLPEEEKV